MDLFNYKKVGGDLSLDFINTANSRYNQHYQELLIEFSDLVNWAQKYYQYEVDEKSNLISIEDIRLLRNSMYNILYSIVHKVNVSSKDLQLLNQWLKETHNIEDIQQSDEGTIKVKYLDEVGISSILFPIVRSFYQLLHSPNLINKVKQCGNSNCDWFFIDKSKNQSKHWCSMELCGNREKARRFYKSKKIKS